MVFLLATNQGFQTTVRTQLSDDDVVDDVQDLAKRCNVKEEPNNLENIERRIREISAAFAASDLLSAESASGQRVRIQKQLREKYDASAGRPATGSSGSDDAAPSASALALRASVSASASASVSCRCS